MIALLPEGMGGSIWQETTRKNKPPHVCRLSSTKQHRKEEYMKATARIVTIIAALCLLITAAGTVSAETIEADIVVVGAGGSGLAAAVSAAQGGAKVVVLEKMPAVGGTTSFSEGIFAAESSLERERNVVITKDQMFTTIMEYSHWRANARLVRNIVDKSPDTIEWLKDQGVEFKDLLPNYPGGLPAWHIINGRGKAMIATFKKNAEEMGVTFYYNTSGKKLITDGKGNVVGVIAEGKGKKTMEFRSKAVIIATGGFANNKEMVKEYAGFGDELVIVGNINKVGEGIKMAWEAGAASEGEGVLQLYRPGVPGESTTSHLNAAGRQPYLWVNQDGQRFCDESLALQWPWAGNALANQRGRIMYNVFDENTKTYLMEKGIDLGVGVMVPVTTKLVNIDKDLARGIEKGYAFIGSSINDLAKKTGMDPKALQATIDEYNASCAAFRDKLFAKDPKYMQPVKEAKFYAIKLYPATLGTLGGIKINENTQAVNKDNQPIGGLFAAGNCAGGMYGDSYDLKIPGGTLGFAVNSGRIAGENALKHIGK